MIDDISLISGSNWNPLKLKHNFFPDIAKLSYSNGATLVSAKFDIVKYDAMS